MDASQECARFGISCGPGPSSPGASGADAHRLVQDPPATEQPARRPDRVLPGVRGAAEVGHDGQPAGRDANRGCGPPDGAGGAGTVSPPSWVEQPPPPACARLRRSSRLMRRPKSFSLARLPTIEKAAKERQRPRGRDPIRRPEDAVSPARVPSVSFSISEGSIASVERKWNGAKCAMTFHGESFFGLARSDDYSELHGKNSVNWTPPSACYVSLEKQEITVNHSPQS